MSFCHCAGLPVNHQKSYGKGARTGAPPPPEEPLLPLLGGSKSSAESEGIDGGAGTSACTPPLDERTEPAPAFPKAPAAAPVPVTDMDDVEALEEAVVDAGADGTPDGMAPPAGAATPSPMPREGDDGGYDALSRALPPLVGTVPFVPFLPGADDDVAAAAPLPCPAETGAGAVSAGLTEAGFSAGALAACAASLFFAACAAVAPLCFAGRDEACVPDRTGAFGSMTTLCGAVLPPRLPLPEDFASGSP